MRAVGAPDMLARVFVTLFSLNDRLSELHWAFFERRPFLRVCGLKECSLSGPVFRLQVFHALFLGLEAFRLQAHWSFRLAQWVSGRSVGHLFPGARVVFCSVCCF